LKLKPKDIKARASLAGSLKKESKKAEALKEYERIIQDDPGNEEAYRQAGLLSEELGNTVRAGEIFSKMAVLFPESAFPPGRLGLLAEKREDIVAAETFYETALKKTIMNELYVYTHLAAIREKRGNNIDAELLYRQGLEKILDHSQEIFMDFISSMERNKGSLDLMKLIEISEKEKGTEEVLDAALTGVHNGFTARGDADGELEYFLKLTDKYKTNKKPLSSLPVCLKTGAIPTGSSIFVKRF